MPTSFGAYTIYEELGAGGMASVHRADWRPIGKKPRRVALKRLYPHTSSNEELVAMFIDEARLARYLRHSNIARVYEFGRINGQYFISFEFVDGPTLQQLMEHCAVHVGYIPVPIVLQIACQLLDALHHAHNLCDEDGLVLGLVHRDVSPQNLIVSTTGFVKLIDFGLAKAKQSSHESQSGIIKGKLRYVAPEYLEGGLDVRCDLWAVGVLLHELLTGKPLFDAPDDFGMIDQVRHKAIPPPSRFRAEVTSDLDEIVLLALQRSPGKRWQNAATLRTALAREARKFPLVTKAQLVAWVNWAFAQKTLQKEDSGLSALQEIIEAPPAAPEVPERPPSPSVATETVEPKPRSATPVRAVLPIAPRRRIWPWLVALACLSVIGASIAYHYLLKPKPPEPEQTAPAPTPPAEASNCPLALDGAVSTLQNIKNGVRFTIKVPAPALAEARRRAEQFATSKMPDAKSCPVVTEGVTITATAIPAGTQLDIVTQAVLVDGLRAETRDRVKNFSFTGASIKRAKQ